MTATVHDHALPPDNHTAPLPLVEQGSESLVGEGYGVSLAEDEAVDIKLYPDSFQLITNNEISVGDISGLPLINVKNVALDNPLNRALKRALDMVVSAIVLILFSPVMLLIALLIKLDTPGPVFFVQERVGLDGTPRYCR